MGMKDSRLLKNTHPGLFEEWDFDKNLKYSWDTTSTRSGRKVWWKCKNGHSWDAAVFSRTDKINPSGCRYCCHNSPPTPAHNFAATYPELLKEWDYDKNTVDPSSISPKSSKVFWWKCKYGHSWKTRVAHRANGHGCYKCKGQSSKQEVFLYFEAKYFFPNALYRHKINKIECDIYLPDENIGIEFDSTHYHAHKIDKDADKVSKLREYGIEIISVREYKMPMINRLTVGYNNNCDNLEVSKNLMALLGQMLNRQDLTDYSTTNKPINEQAYLDEIKSYPNILDRTLALQNPELAKEWDYENNGGLTPTDYAPFSHKIVKWICPVGHPYEATIANRNNLNQKCPHCQNHSSLSYSINKNREPLHPKRIRKYSKPKEKRYHAKTA